MRCKRIYQFPGGTEGLVCRGHDHVEPTAVDSPADSPSDSGHSASVMEAVPEVFEAARRFELNRRFLHTGLESLDSVDLHVVFRTRALVMKSVPFLLKGSFRAALICALREVLDGNNQGHELRVERGWKMLTLLPRMLLARPRGGKVSKKKLQARIDLFASGQSVVVGCERRVRSCWGCFEGASITQTQTGQHPDEGAEGGSARAAGRQALEGADVAPGNLATLAQLTNPARRPPIPRDHLSWSATAVPAQPFELDPELFCKNLRSARRGAAPGPSIWHDNGTPPRLGRFRPRHGSLRQFRRACEPGVCPQRRFGRVPTWSRHCPSKAGWWDSGNRCWRHSQIDHPHDCPADLQTSRGGNSPAHQYALQTKSRGECVSHMVQMLTQLNPRQTVVSVDGVGAFDLVSRNAMLQGLGNMIGGAQVLPFVRLFYSDPSKVRAASKGIR